MGNSSGVPEDRTATLKEFRDRYAKLLVAGFNHLSLSHGVCHGMCLDWIRLMLNGKIQLFQEYSTLQTVNAGLILKQHEKMHYLFHTATKSVTNEMLSDLDEKVTLARTGGISQKKHAQNAMREIDAQANDTDQMYSLYYERFRSEFRKQFVSFLTFDDIQVDFERNSYVGDPTRDISDFFAAIRTCIGLLPKGRCAMCHLTGSKKGHVIAYYKHTSAWHLFDANFGWYVCGGLDATWEMFKDLWYAAYRTHGYNEVRWRIFKRS